MACLRWLGGDGGLAAPSPILLPQHLEPYVGIGIGADSSAARIDFIGIRAVLSRRGPLGIARRLRERRRCDNRGYCCCNAKTLHGAPPTFPILRLGEGEAGCKPFFSRLMNLRTVR